jgi:hypothetical protein
MNWARTLAQTGNTGRSKLSEILYALYLSRNLHVSHPKVLSNATHLGFAETKIGAYDVHEPFLIIRYWVSVPMAPLKKD